MGHTKSQKRHARDRIEWLEGAQATCLFAYRAATEMIGEMAIADGDTLCMLLEAQGDAARSYHACVERIINYEAFLSDIKIRDVFYH